MSVSSRGTVGSFWRRISLCDYSILHRQRFIYCRGGVSMRNGAMVLRRCAAEPDGSFSAGHRRRGGLRSAYIDNGIVRARTFSMWGRNGRGH